MATIGYDQPVRNLIDGLNATGHVTHTSHAKTMVTLHHNGGVNLSHQTILNIWKTRPASAHFDVDSAGAVAQYVKADEYAWACASRTGNETSISIELANSTGSPGWLVSDTTWRSGARLAGWLFAHVIKARPTSSNLVYHHHWFATACAGPYMDSIYTRVLAETQAAYDAFVNGNPTPIAPQEADMQLSDQVDVRDPKTGAIVQVPYSTILARQDWVYQETLRQKAVLDAIAAKILTPAEVSAAAQAGASAAIDAKIAGADVTLQVKP